MPFRTLSLSNTLRLPSFSSALTVHASFTPQHVLNDFLKGYNDAFPDPNNYETPEQFATWLNNPHHRSDLQSLFGPFAACVLTIRDHHQVVAAAAFDLFGTTRSIHLSSAYTHPDHRRKGLLRALIDQIRWVANELSGLPKPYTIVLETENPLTCPPSSQDPTNRLRMWGHMGLDLIDIPYKQPPLSDHHQAIDYLLLGVLTSHTLDTLSATWLFDHLTRFFVLSVFKGDIERLTPYRPMLDAMAARRAIPLRTVEAWMTQSMTTPLSLLQR